MREKKTLRGKASREKPGNNTSHTKQQVFESCVQGDATVLSDLRRITGEAEYVPTCREEIAGKYRGVERIASEVAFVFDFKLPSLILD
jgi:hypothetical protein